MASIVSAGTTSATALNMSADTSGVLQLASNNGTVGVTLSTAQNLLVGSTTDNGYRLKVVGGNASNLLVDNGGQQYTQLLFQRNGTANTGGDILIDGTSSSMLIRGLLSGPMIFYTSVSAGSPVERMSITSAGVVQVGNNSGTGEVFAQNTVKVWGAIVASTGAMYNSFGVSSSSRVSTGVYQINFSRTLASQRFGCGLSQYSAGYSFINNESTTGCRVNTTNTSNSNVDADVQFLIAGGS